MRALPCAVVAWALLLAACGPRYLREPVYDQDGVQVGLRSETRSGKTVPRGFSHPVVISGVRVAHVLARIDVRLGEGGKDGKDRTPAFSTILLYQVGEQVARAFARATPDQEVVVRAVRVEKRFGLFTSKYLTSFVAEMRGDDLWIHLSRVDWEVPKDQEGDLPEPWADKEVQDFKVLPADGLVPTGKQAVSAAWRSDAFREPSWVRVGPGGKLLRRTVLLDSEAPPEGAAPEKEPEVRPEDLSADALRALADLQDLRARGEISEAVYQQRRRDLLREEDDRIRSQQVPPPAPAAP